MSTDGRATFVTFLLDEGAVLQAQRANGRVSFESGDEREFVSSYVNWILATFRIDGQ